MSDKEQLAAILSQLNDLRANQPTRVNGATGFMAERLKLNVGTVLTICGALITCTWIVGAKLSAIQDGQDKGWRIRHQQTWAHQLHLENPNLNVPDVDGVVNGETIARHDVK